MGTGIGWEDAQGTFKTNHILIEDMDYTEV